MEPHKLKPLHVLPPFPQLFPYMRFRLPSSLFEPGEDWEKELFGGAYDEAKPFERCKYGALGVMNDYRGITSAYQRHGCRHI